LMLIFPENLTFRQNRKHVTPAKAGVQKSEQNPWIPAFAGMTAKHHRTRAQYWC